MASDFFLKHDSKFLREAHGNNFVTLMTIFGNIGPYSPFFNANDDLLCNSIFLLSLECLAFVPRQFRWMHTDICRVKIWIFSRYLFSRIPKSKSVDNKIKTLTFLQLSLAGQDDTSCLWQVWTVIILLMLL